VALVRRCFADGHHNPRRRPTAEEWEQALGEAEQALVRCGNGHYYSGHLSRCPHCGAGRVTIQVPLPPVAPRAIPRPVAKPAPPIFTPPVVLRPTTVACPGCGHGNAADESYCQGCARPLASARPCRHCGRAVPSNAPYCGHCGRPVASPTSLCPNCRYANAAGEAYCQRCGRPLTGSRPCPRCGQQMPANLRYCLGCGNQV